MPEWDAEGDGTPVDPCEEFNFADVDLCTEDFNLDNGSEEGQGLAAIV